MNLYNYFLSNAEKPIHKNKHYFPIYEKHFRRFVDRPVVFFEIGSGGGGSSCMWKRYFGPLARIVTVDIRPECLVFADDQISVRIGDQSDTAFLNSLVEEFGRPDIVLDDGSHQMHHVVATFKNLYNNVDQNGLYIVEDMHIAYWPEWGGGLGRITSFIELCKTLIDELNADHVNGILRPLNVKIDAPETFQPTEFTHSTMSISFYDSLIAFERGRLRPISKASMVTGDPNQPIG